MGFFADLLGNAANAGSDMLGRRIAKDDKIEQEERAAKLAEDRARTNEAIRLDLEEKKAQAKNQRLSEQTQAVEAAAPAITRERQLGEAQTRAPSVDRNVLDTIKERLTSEQVSKYYGVNDGQVSKIDDSITAARRGGMYELEAGLKSSRDAVVKQLQEERKDGIAQQRADAATTSAEAATTRAEAAATRAERTGSSEKANTVQSTQVDGNGYLNAVYRDGTSKRVVGADGQPVTAASFEARVDKAAATLIKEGGAKYAKMPLEDVRTLVRNSLIQKETPATAAAPAGKPWEKYKK